MFCKQHIKHLFLYLYHKFKNRHLVRFPYSAQMSHRCWFEGMNAIGAQTDYYGRIGLGSYIGCDCHISADIGRFSSLGNRISQIVETHPIQEPFVTTSPMFTSIKKQTGYTFAKQQYADEYRFFESKREIAFLVGNDCWIGNDVCVIGGVRVGDGAVVLSRAIVTKDVPAYAIVGGIPAKVIGFRYDEETIKLLQKVRWWDRGVEWLKHNAELLCDMTSFKEYFKNNQ